MLGSVAHPQMLLTLVGFLAISNDPLDQLSRSNLHGSVQRRHFYLDFQILEILDFYSDYLEQLLKRLYHRLLFSYLRRKACAIDPDDMSRGRCFFHLFLDLYPFTSSATTISGFVRLGGRNVPCVLSGMTQL